MLRHTLRPEQPVAQREKKFYNTTIIPIAYTWLLKRTAVNMGQPSTVSGAGLIDIGAAMLTMAAPTPVINSLDVPRRNYCRGSSVCRNGERKFLHYTIQSFLRSSSVTTFVDGSHVIATVPTFSGNPAIQVQTPCITPSCTDGGISNALYFSPIKKNVVVTMDNKTKSTEKYFLSLLLLLP